MSGPILGGPLQARLRVEIARLARILIKGWLVLIPVGPGRNRGSAVRRSPRSVIYRTHSRLP
jgi:hypothetical protein